MVQADPKQARRRDDDGRLPIHWAASSNQPDIVMLLTQQKGFDPDVEVSKKRGARTHFLLLPALTSRGPYPHASRMTAAGRRS